MSSREKNSKALQINTQNSAKLANVYNSNISSNKRSIGGITSAR